MLVFSQVTSQGRYFSLGFVTHLSVGEQLNEGCGYIFVIFLLRSELVVIFWQ